MSRSYQDLARALAEFSNQLKSAIDCTALANKLPFQLVNKLASAISKKLLQLLTLGALIIEAICMLGRRHSSVGGRAIER